MGLLYDLSTKYKTLSIVGDSNATLVLDLNGSNNLETDYAVIMGVILANGNADKKAALVEAINLRDMAALKQIGFDGYMNLE